MVRRRTRGCQLNGLVRRSPTNEVWTTGRPASRLRLTNLRRGRMLIWSRSMQRSWRRWWGNCSTWSLRRRIWGENWRCTRDRRRNLKQTTPFSKLWYADFTYSFCLLTFRFSLWDHRSKIECDQPQLLDPSFQNLNGYLKWGSPNIYNNPQWRCLRRNPIVRKKAMAGSAGFAISKITSFSAKSMRSTSEIVSTSMVSKTCSTTISISPNIQRCLVDDPQTRPSRRRRARRLKVFLLLHRYLSIYQEATDIYGLIHARYIVTPKGLAIMK